MAIDIPDVRSRGAIDEERFAPHPAKRAHRGIGRRRGYSGGFGEGGVGTGAGKHASKFARKTANRKSSNPSKSRDRPSSVRRPSPRRGHVRRVPEILWWQVVAVRGEGRPGFARDLSFCDSPFCGQISSMLSRSRSHAAFAEARRYIPGGVNSPVRAFSRGGGRTVLVDRAAGAAHLGYRWP